MIIEDDRMYDESRILINGLITKEGTQEGNVNIQSMGYARLSRKNNLKNTGLQISFANPFLKITRN